MIALLLLPAGRAEVGSRACAPCHAVIYRAYTATGMARSSGQLNADSLIERFPSSEHGVTYKGAVQYTFAAPDGPVGRTLEYFVGSGAVGRSYLYSIDRFLYQAPVSWYTGASRWEMSPGFEKLRPEEMVRPVEPACLRCHASRVQWIEGTANQYGQPAFLEGGVSCERCHGPGERHIADGKGGAIVNPVRLDPARRDSVCAQCHLSGATEISTGTTYQPGQLLSHSSAVFVWEDRSRPMPVISHFERMSRSRCRQAAPEKLWCGTCHDPHTRPAPEMRIAWYRSKCLECHEKDACTAPQQARASRTDDCTACHMPKSEVRSVRHAAYTDHSIPRRPGSEANASSAGGENLVLFGGGEAGSRELALAWADVALRENNRAWGMRAFGLLQQAHDKDPDDPRVASQLAQLLDRMGRQKEACTLYERIVRLQPSSIAPAVNLGTCYASAGRMEAAMRLWQGALERNPALEGARMNLAVAQFRSGDAASARATLAAGLKLNPLSSRMRQMMQSLPAER